MTQQTAGQSLGIILILDLVVLFSAAAIAGEGLMIENAWIREAPPNAPALAGYMLIKNKSGKTRTLVGAASTDFAKVMPHRTELRDGMAHMVHQHQIKIAPNSSLSFRPGGYHLMLMQPKKRLKAGDTVAIELTWANGSKQWINYTVKKHIPMSSGTPSHSENHQHPMNK